MNIDHEKDIELVALCLKNNRQAQRTLYEKYKVSLFILCQRYAKDRHQAEDFLQEGFIHFFKNIEKYDAAKAPLIVWMRRLFVNKCLSHLRTKKKNFQFNEIHDYSDVLKIEPGAMEQMNRKDLLNLITKLPAGYQTVFNLYVIDGYKHREIAEKLEISEGASKSQLFRAKQQLAEMISEQENEMMYHG